MHTERVGTLAAPVEFVFNTPSHHRVHHASDRDHLDKNYGGILIVWDRLFGSYAGETHRPTYELTKNVDTVDYVFAPPEWQPAVGVDASRTATASSRG